MVAFQQGAHKPSPPKSGRRKGQPRQGRSPAQSDDLRATQTALLSHGRSTGGGTARPVPLVARESLAELNFAPREVQKPKDQKDWNKWELRRLDSWQPSGPDPNKVKDPQGKGVFSAFDPKGGAARETGAAMPGARDTWKPALGRRSETIHAAESGGWSPNRHYPEGLHQLKGAARAPHPFNMTTEYLDADRDEPDIQERKKAEGRLNALRMLRTKMETSFRLHGREITDVASMFEAMDADGSGGLDYAEFKEGLKALDIALGPKQMASLLEALDADGDGEITIREFLEQCDDAYRADGALGELDQEAHDRAGVEVPAAKKKTKLLPNPSVFGETMNLTMAQDISLKNRHHTAGGATRFRLAAKVPAPRSI